MMKSLEPTPFMYVHSHTGSYQPLSPRPTPTVKSPAVCASNKRLSGALGQAGAYSELSNLQIRKKMEALRLSEERALPGVLADVFSLLVLLLMAWGPIHISVQKC